jgi:hypothetical protein
MKAGKKTFVAVCQFYFGGEWYLNKIIYRLRTISFTLLALFFSLMWLLTLLLHAKSTPLPGIVSQKPLILLGTAALELVIFLGICKAGLSLSNHSEKKYVALTLAIYTAIQVFFVLMFPVNAYEDAAIVEGLAKEILNGRYSSLGVGNYLGYYPNNIGITMFFALVYSLFPNSLIVLRLFNVIFNTVAAWLIYKLYKEIYPEDEDKARGILLLTICFIPPLILDNLTYGDTLCNTLCLAGVLNAMRFVKSSRLKHAVCTALFLMLANFMRSVALLFMLAVLLYWTFNSSLFRKPVNLRKVVAGALLVVFSFSLPLRIFSFVGNRSGMLEEPVGLHANPIWRWINIGFPADNKLGYWDGGRNTSIFIWRYKCNPKLASNFFKQDMLEKYQSIGKKDTLKRYFKKTFWLWTEGTYNVNFYGLSQTLKNENFQLYNTPLIKYIEPGDMAVRNTLDWLLHASNWITLALSVLCLGSSIKRKDFRLELFVYTIFLYIGFYFFWEIKSRYLFGLYPFFLIMSYKSIEDFINKGRQKN